MALIKCPECGKDISDRAVICIGCGFPIRDYLKEKQKINNEESGNDSTTQDSAMCPFCNSKKIDVDGYCDDCGMKILTAMPANNHNIYNAESSEEEDIPDEAYSICPVCGKYNIAGVYTCERCKHKYNMHEYSVIYPPKKEKSEGIVKYSIFGVEEKVFCPRCGSENCSRYEVQNTIPRKVKTRYAVNLNPLRPFTLINKKEKTIRNEQINTSSRFICNRCGKIFD